MVIEPVSSLFAFFRDAVDAAAARRRVATQPATTEYLANLLVTFAGPEGGAVLERSVVLSLDEALSRSAGERLVGLQTVGDASLYLVSFFPDHLARSHVDIGLYVDVGSFAYARAAEIVRSTGASEAGVLDELTLRFVQHADVLAEVAESSALGAVTKNLVQIFDRWKSTGSTRALEEMARAGAFPVMGRGHKC